LITTKTPSSLTAVTHEAVSGTHNLREEPLATIPHEEHSDLQVLEERFDTEGFDHAPVLHCRDHESFLVAQGLATKEVVEKIPCGPTNKEVAPVDWGIEYRTVVDTSLCDSGSVDISGVLDTMAYIEYRWYMMIQWCAVVYNSIHLCTVVCSGFLGCFPWGDLQTGTSDISLSLVHPGSVSGWTSFMERYISQRLIFDSDITRVGIESRIPTGLGLQTYH
jgi:hypothetical protein